MRNFQKKRNWKNLTQSRPVLLLLGILVLIFVWGMIGFLGKMQVTMENKKIAESKFLELQKEKDTLSKAISKLNTDSGVEESIRDKFPVVKDGEGMIVIVDDKAPVKAPEQESNGFINFFKNWFK